MKRSGYVSVILIVNTMLFCTFKTTFIGVCFLIAMLIFVLTMAVNWNE